MIFVDKIGATTIMQKQKTINSIVVMVESETIDKIHSKIKIGGKSLKIFTMLQMLFIFLMSDTMTDKYEGKTGNPDQMLIS